MSKVRTIIDYILLLLVLALVIAFVFVFCSGRSHGQYCWQDELPLPSPYYDSSVVVARPVTPLIRERVRVVRPTVPDHFPPSYRIIETSPYPMVEGYRLHYRQPSYPGAFPLPSSAWGGGYGGFCGPSG